jgi:crotonobetainyl-CoA:carnitine CoA-transferase CaiB-like acyl-CoA transferase
MRPLDDIRILALEQFGAGPFGSVHLADLGADVIKIEDPATGGDVSRSVPPFNEGDSSLFFETFNRNKRSINLDLTTAAGRSVFDDLVKVSDVVFSNLRGDVPAKLRITYDDLKHLNPAIVCCSISGFGMTGPRQKDPGYDYILQGLAGWMSMTGEPDGPPTKSGASLVDYTGGLVGALSLLAGVHAARRSGVGMDCDVSLYDTAISRWFRSGTIRRPTVGWWCRARRRSSGPGSARRLIVPTSPPTRGSSTSPRGSPIVTPAMQSSTEPYVRVRHRNGWLSFLSSVCPSVRSSTSRRPWLTRIARRGR